MAAGGVGYWPDNYWHLDYWHVEYWPETSPVSAGQSPRGTRNRYGYRVNWITLAVFLLALEPLLFDGVLLLRLLL